MNTRRCVHLFEAAHARVLLKNILSVLRQVEKSTWDLATLALTSPNREQAPPRKLPGNPGERKTRVIELTLVNDWQEGRGIIPFSRSILGMWISM